MTNPQITVVKLTDENLMREACESTFNGKSFQTLVQMYKAEHSPARTQLFWITFKNLDLFISTHIIRHHVGSTPFQLTCRDDRDGGNPGLDEKVNQVIECINNGNIEAATEILSWIKNNCDRHTKVRLSILVNSQSLIDMAKLRFCNQASKETTSVFLLLKEKIKLVDPALASMMVRKCVYRGGICGERCCGFNQSPKFKEELKEYLSNFSTKQRGILDQWYNQ